jgi:hypothetical protein
VFTECSLAVSVAPCRGGYDYVLAAGRGVASHHASILGAEVTSCDRKGRGQVHVGNLNPKPSDWELQLCSISQMELFQYYRKYGLVSRSNESVNFDSKRV